MSVARQAVPYAADGIPSCSEPAIRLLKADLLTSWAILSVVIREGRGPDWLSGVLATRSIATTAPEEEMTSQVRQLASAGCFVAALVAVPDATEARCWEGDVHGVTSRRRHIVATGNTAW